MIDIGSIMKSLHPSETRERIEQIQTKGKRLALRIVGTFTLVGHRAIQLVGRDDEHYHALVHNEPDDPTDYLVVHPAGSNEHYFEASSINKTWIVTYIDDRFYDVLMEATANVLLDHANQGLAEFAQKNFGGDMKPLTEKEINVDSFAEDLSKIDLRFSHAGNKRLAFR